MGHRTELIRCGQILQGVAIRLTRFVFESDNFQRRSVRSRDFRISRLRGVPRGPSVGGLGVTFDPENQVSRSGHVDFPILGNVTSRVMKSDFHEEAMRAKCTDKVKNSQMLPG